MVGTGVGVRGRRIRGLRDECDHNRLYTCMKLSENKVQLPLLNISIVSVAMMMYFIGIKYAEANDHGDTSSFLDRGSNRR